VRPVNSIYYGSPLDITLPLHFLHFLRVWSGLIDEILGFELLRGSFKNKAYIAMEYRMHEQ
jgi:hypothetical protein